MNLTTVAAEQPTKPASITVADDVATSYAELDAASRRLADVFTARGLTRGDSVAILMENGTGFLVASLAAQRSGLYFVPVNWHLSAGEAAYIVSDSASAVLITSPPMLELARSIVAVVPTLTAALIVDGEADGFEPFSLHATDVPPPVEDEREGYYMFYSSGTTGRPKGIKPELVDAPFGTGFMVEKLLAGLYGFDRDTRYLTTGPMYHAAPLGWSLGTIALGGTSHLMPRFDPEECLAAIEKYRITHIQFVPTMFVRLLKLPPDLRAKYDLSSLRTVVHAAAPCPVDVKRQMIDWLGPIIFEYYAGSEGICFFAISSAEWLAHPGSVGRAVQGVPHVLDEDGLELPAGEIGQLWFEVVRPFEYHNDPDKTRDAFNAKGWSTLGDLGHLDAEGYLYLADRRTDLILSGGVNIYPREIEEALAMHPLVADVAVIGLPRPDWGQEVRAVVQPAPGVTPGPELAATLLASLDGRLARYKHPRTIDFTDEVPRLPSGKILRRVVRDKYLT